MNGEPPPEYIARENRGDRLVSSDPQFLQAVEGKSWEIIGVVEDVKMFGLDVAPNPALYLDYRQNPRSTQWRTMATFEVKFLIRSRSRPSDVPLRAKAAVAAINRSAVVNETVLMSDLVSQSIGGRGSNKLMLVISVAFGTLALIFAAIGIYGVVSHNVTSRVREIGIRLAMGATRRDIVVMMALYAMRLIGAGVGLGLMGGWAAGRMLRSQLFGISFTDAPTYGLAVALLAVTAFVSCLFPLRRAMSVEPIMLFRS